MKKKFFIVAILLLAPFLVLAVTGESYDMIVNCQIDTIPKFIKTAIDIMMKIGIPVGAVFIVFSGFSFLTAQGDEGKLKAAKNGLFWTIIGITILLGSWLFATALLSTITSLMGGNVVGETTTGCGNGSVETDDEGPASNVVSAPVASKATEEKVAEGIFFVPERSKWGPSVPVSHGFSIVESTPEEDAVFQKSQEDFKKNREFLSNLDSYVLNTFYNMVYKTEEPASVVKVVLSNPKLISSKSDCVFVGGVENDIKKAAKAASNEESWIYLKYKNGTGEWKRTDVGDHSSVTFPYDFVTSSLANPDISLVYQIHTHPASEGNTFSPPSPVDVGLVSLYMSETFSSAFFSKIHLGVIDSVGNTFTYGRKAGQKTDAYLSEIKQFKSIANSVFIGTSPEAKKLNLAFSEDFKKRSGPSLKEKIDSGNYSDSDYAKMISSWYNSLSYAIREALNGNLGESTRTYAENVFVSKIKSLTSFKLEESFNKYMDTGDVDELIHVSTYYDQLGFDMTNEIVSAEDLNACGY